MVNEIKCIGQHPISKERTAPELYKMEGFNRKEGGAGKLLAREKKGLFQARSPTFPHRGARGSYYADDLISLGGDGEGPRGWIILWVFMGKCLTHPLSFLVSGGG